MFDQFDVYVENSLTSDIRVIRKFPDGSSDIDVTIASREVNRFLIPDPGVLLIINPPNSVDIKSCPFNVTENAYLISWSIIEDQWRIKSALNDGVPEVAKAAYVIVGPLDASH